MNAPPREPLPDRNKAAPRFGVSVEALALEGASTENAATRAVKDNDASAHPRPPSTADPGDMARSGR
jgi:hypothetical protein